jgi:hypothetical protein
MRSIREDSDQAFVCKAIIAGVSIYKVIKHRQVEHFAGLHQFLGELDVGLAGCEVTAGVVMDQNNGRSQLLERFFEDHFRVGNGAGYSPAADLPVAHYPVGPIEQDDPELFMRQIHQVRTDVRENISGTSDAGFAFYH